MAENDEFTFVARIANYGGSGSLAAVLDKNLEAYHNIERGDLLQIKVLGVKKGIRTKSKEKESSSTQTSEPQIPKSANVGNLISHTDENVGFVGNPIAPQIGYRSGLSFKRNMKTKPFLVVVEP